ncbi:MULTISPECIES: methyltransferase domain-containing protein [unclassified Mesorhizobium]|uniref:methyltransferase domain-containing protein n=1 Tax=unclassified Mesorhizobium TaxID=325217 RepID=UPI00112B0815|nr:MULTISPECIES: methyltransferase domain-containing protein [unclassified Mesorhizobium]TPJ55205.1 methyltransferase domain-containing protein [Mesorhizobium sp. B2-6-4]TPL22885.1 methyltransferase domain-containing protein [Mesorhizobium sp. B2-4-10]TPM09476.1 methyltransferase domain-containing protein [Mesorhizobium sp. B2-3-8]TPM19050.1 methyltransferase domain-containing protein [Mesorhizobium sp. B2-3-7]TPM19305.1 methyltransferase domain-containing protein [Mesorhizobium sp. B2-3-6]
MKKSFDELYKTFEDRFRGPRELVKERQKIYLPLLTQLTAREDAPNLAIDLGCGRGEWLEILTEAGLTAVGVDFNESMAQGAVDRGLRIEPQDAIEYLRGQADDSVAIISAFHMVEHVSTDYLIELLDECLRVLTDDGVLILETPNPENISVATHTFHLDPTHKSPLPPSLLEFLVEQAGFSETAILRLNGAPMIEAGPMESSVHLMFEVARDYSCLARKRDGPAAGELKSLAAFVKTASQQMPADVEQIKGWLHSADDEIARNSEAVKGMMSSTTDQLQQLTESLASQSELMRAGQTALTDTLASLGRSLAERDAEVARLRRHMAERDAEIARLNKSVARRGLTWILGRLHSEAAGLKRAAVSSAKHLFRPFATQAMRFVLKHPRLRTRTIDWLRANPALLAHARLFAASRGLTGAPITAPPPGSSSAELMGIDPSLRGLSAHGRRIHAQLKRAIGMKRQSL